MRPQNYAHYKTVIIDGLHCNFTNFLFFNNSKFGIAAVKSYNELTSNTAKKVVISSTFASRTLIVIVTSIVVWIDSFGLLFTTCPSTKEKTVRVFKNDKEDKKENKKLIQLHFASQLLL